MRNYLLKDKMWERGLNVNELAARAGLCRQTITKILHAKIAPRKETIIKITQALCCHPEDIGLTIVDR